MGLGFEVWVIISQECAHYTAADTARRGAAQARSGQARPTSALSAERKVWPWRRLMHLDCFVDQQREDSSILIAGPDRFSLATERTYNSTLYLRRKEVELC